jgi:hypothetical protein
MKLEVTHSQLMYYLWCFKFRYNCGSCESHAKYQKWLRKDTLQHCGDCTKDSCLCERCVLQGIEIEAENILKSIISNDRNKKGWCKKECLTNCSFKLGIKK